MSLSTARSNSTKGISALQSVCRNLTEKVNNWQTSTDADLSNQIGQIEDALSSLQLKTNRLKEYSDVLDRTVDNLELDDSDMRKHDTYVEQIASAMDEALELQDSLQIQMNRANRATRTRSSSFSSAREETLPPTQVIASQMKLLDLPKVPTFSGNAWDFENFLAIFKEVVDKSPQSKFLKLNHLMASLKGEPKELLGKFKLREENYDKALDLLISKYGNKEKTIIELTSRLKKETADSDSTKDQRKLLDKLAIIIAQLEEMEEPIETRIVKELIVEKFAYRIKQDVFKKKLKTKEVEWTTQKILEDLEAFIGQEEELNELLPRKEAHHQNKKSENKDQKKSQPQKANSFNSQKTPHCIFCEQEGHWGSDCPTVKEPKARLELVKKQERCIKCTRKGHSSDTCNSRTCSICQGGHHFSLCFKKNSSSNKSTTAPTKKPDLTKENNGFKKKNTHAAVTNQEDSEDEEPADQTTATVAREHGPTAFIPTLQAIAFNEASDEWQQISIMMDSGADQTYITKELQDKLCLPDRGSKTINTRVFNTKTSDPRKYGKSTIKIRTDDKDIKMQVYVSENLAGRIPKAQLSKDDMSFLLKSKTRLNEESLNKNSKPDMILGCDYWNEIVTGELIQLPSGIMIIGTKLGFTTMGKSSSTPMFEETLHFMVMEDHDQADLDREIEEEQRRDTQMKEENEFSGPLEKEKSAKEQQTIEFFNKTIEKREDGYCARLPILEDHPELPDNFLVSFSRLKQLQQKYAPDILQKIDEIIQEQERRGYIEKVCYKLKQTRRCRYSPIQIVLTPHKVTTPCRMVIDGSSKTKNSLSLNDIIEKGPTILPDLIDMLIRFRAGKIACISDVEKAFLQVWLNELDRDLTRIIWMKDFNQPLTMENMQVYRYTRVLFGLNASPFLLAATILHHLKTEENQTLASTIGHSLYVDNLVLTTDEEQDAINIYHEVKAIFNRLHMNMREFQSNSSKFNDMVEDCDKAKDQIMKVLGIPWNSMEDSLKMTANIEELEHDSRRTVSSAIASIFDPLGFLAPLILPAKLFQRDRLWDNKYTWKNNLTPEDQELWKEVTEKIDGFSKELPRNVVEKSKNNRLITFCDASKDATAYGIYANNKLGTHLLFAKSKIKPLKEVWTIPKLETHAMSMGSEKTLQIFKALQLEGITVEEVIIMTDSQIALDWLKAPPSKMNGGQLIKRRLRNIRLAASELEDNGVKVRFGHVRSEDNPADLATRGCTKTSFSESIWWKGPPFLQNGTNEWEQNSKLFQLQTNEENMECQVFMTIQEDEDTIFNHKVTNSFEKMKRIVVMVMRFLKHFSMKISEENRLILEQKIPGLSIFKLNSQIEAEEIDQAEIVLLKDHQRTITRADIKKMQNLGIVKDQKGLLVCRGRLAESDLPAEAKEPILVKAKTPLVKQIIRHYHGRYHKTLEHTVDATRRKFWIPRLRQQTKSWIRNCVKCQRAYKRPCRYPNMGPLPKYRVMKTRPFAHTGLDNFGPITFKKEDGSDGSAYGTLFACAATRLIHTEVVKDMSTLQFLQAFRRFVSIRGRPKAIVSDNGSNFVLGQKIIQEATKRADCPHELHQIKWKFITPYAPWKEGMYESMVKVFKQTFQKAVGRNKLSYDELCTVVQEVTASVNSRPLTKLEDDINSDTPIRPIDFISQEMDIHLPLEGAKEITEDFLPSEDKASKETMMNTIAALKSSIKATEAIWNRWQSKYLAELREGHKLRMDNKRGTPSPPKEGQLVLITDELQPRNSWKMGRVTKINYSTDGALRDVDIINSNGRSLNRAINLLIPLELDNENPEEDSTQDTTQEEETSNKAEEDTSTKGQEPDQPTRYNLRDRKKINYKEDNVNDSFFSFSTLNIPTWWITCIMMCLLFGTTEGSSPTSKCNANGIQIMGDVKQFEACAENYCTTKSRWQWNRDGGMHVWFPAAIKIHPHLVTIKVDDGATLHLLEENCPAVPFCETIDCNICWSNVANPECHMTWAIVGSSTILFLLALMVHATCKMPVREIFKLAGKILFLIYALFIWCFKRIQNFFHGTQKKRSKWRDLVVILTIFHQFTSTDGCQEIDLLTQFEYVCNNEGRCLTFTEEMMHLNPSHQEGCLRITQNGTIQKDIRVQLMEIELQCIKRTVIYTQHVQTRVWSSKRCPSMGTCKDTKCENVTRTSIIPELNEVNHFVGSTGCTESCGGPGCGCLYFSSGCIFYRIYAVPVSPEPIELFSCVEYRQMAKIKLTITTLNSGRNRANSKEVMLRVGKPNQFKEATVTVDSIQVPPAPALNKWFILSNNSISTWPEYTLPNYRCDKNLQNCQLVEDCQCSPAENQMRCTCRDTEISSWMRQPDTRLPVQAGNIRLEQAEQSVNARIQNTATATISVRISDAWDTKIVKSTQQCEVPNTEATGCYSCQKGATATIRCSSSDEHTMAAVDCEKETFTVECSPGAGSETQINIHANYAQLHRKCTIDCGGMRSTFEITGILKYSGSIWTSINRMIDGNTTLYDELNLPDIGHLATSYMSYLKTVTIALLIVAAVFLTTYTMITNTGLKILGAIARAIWWIIISILSIPFKVLVKLIELIKRKRRHAHLHTLIFFVVGSIQIKTTLQQATSELQKAYTFSHSPLHDHLSLPSFASSSLLFSLPNTNVGFSETHMSSVNEITEALGTISQQQADMQNQLREMAASINWLMDYFPHLALGAFPAGTPAVESFETIRTTGAIIEDVIMVTEDHQGPIQSHMQGTVQQIEQSSSNSVTDDQQGQNRRAPKSMRKLIREHREIYATDHPHAPFARELDCVFCAEKHLSDVCGAVQAASTREFLLGKMRLCRICLKNNHDGRCTEQIKCRYCESPHHHSCICVLPTNRVINRTDLPRQNSGIQRTPTKSIKGRVSFKRPATRQGSSPEPKRRRHRSERSSSRPRNSSPSKKSSSSSRNDEQSSSKKSSSSSRYDDHSSRPRTKEEQRRPKRSPIRAPSKD